MEIYQYWTVPRQTLRMPIPSSAKKGTAERPLKKKNKLESTTSQQNWSKQVERMQSPLSRQSATRSGRQENGQVITLPKIGNLWQCQNYRTIGPISHPSKVTLKVILNIIEATSGEEASEQEGAPQSRASIYKSSVKNIFSTGKTSTMCS